MRAVIHEDAASAYEVQLRSVPRPGDVIDLVGHAQPRKVEVLSVCHIVRDDSPAPLRSSVLAQELKMFVRPTMALDLVL